LSGGPLLAAHRHLAGHLGLAGVTVFTGWVPDPQPYLRHADVFALPSRQEGSGSLALLEALQAGLAPVASDVDGVPEDVTHGDSALLVPAGDIRALAAALRRVVTDAGLRRHLGRGARQTFADRFSAQAFNEALGRTYARLGFGPWS
jgi:glycosyltransferase involved in cell wall biosynthesis